MTHEQIVRMGHTTPYEWDALAQRSIKTRRKIDLRCPTCEAEIHPTDTTHLRCGGCHAPVEVYQHAELTKTADRRVIYAEANGQRKEILRLKLQCLSCERRLQTDETCTNTCGIQTYLILDVQDGELYIQRAANRLDVPRDTHPPEILIRNLPPNAIATRANETPENQTPNQPINQPQARDSQIPLPPNAHTDIAGQIVEYLTDAPNHTATTAEMIAAFGCSPQGFNVEKEKLIEAGKISKLKRGVYQLINHTESTRKDGYNHGKHKSLSKPQRC